MAPSLNRPNLPLIKTKLTAPQRRSSLVERTRLLDLLAEGSTRKLSLICAPPGYGKTTLMTEWIASLQKNEASHRPTICWLSLDAGDNDPTVFLSYFVSAFENGNPLLNRNVSAALEGYPPPPIATTLSVLINSLDDLAHPTCLVLDDYQFITNPAIHTTLTDFLERLPENVRLVIATRSDPPLPLARMRARGQTVELRAADLRFTEAEAAQFLNDVMGLRLDAAAIMSLKERTEGWIAGLQMAALSMRDREDVSGFIAGFSGTNRYILDYLMEEVLARQTVETQRFLLHTSILERLTAPLCEAVLEAEPADSSNYDEIYAPAASARQMHSQEILEYLERANLFLVPLDDERQWYRYHHLFADLLRTQLQKSLRDPGVTQLHLRASEWHEQNGSTLDAIHHASLASDFERVERLIEQNYIEMMNRGEMTWIRFWMGKLSKELVYRRPWLCLYEAFSRSWFGQLGEASLLLNEAEKRIQFLGSDPGAQAMLGYHAYVQSRVTAMQGDTKRAIQLCLIAREKSPASNLGLQIEIGITLGFEYFLTGDFSQASQTLGETIQSCLLVGAVNNPVAAFALLARTDIIQGALHQADDLFQKAAQMIQEEEGQYLDASGLVEVGRSDLFREWNDLEAALVLIQHGLDLLSWWGKADDLALAYVTLARIQLARGNWAEAASAIEKTSNLLQTCGVFSEARSAVETAQIRFRWMQGDESAIARWSEDLEKRLASADSFRFEDELGRITQARLWMAQNKTDQAIHLLSALEEAARSGGRQGRLIEILILKALALQIAGDPAQAQAALDDSLMLAEPAGYMRIFLDEGQPMRTLLIQWRSQADANPLRDYATRLLAQFDLQPDPDQAAREKAPPAANDLVEPLTPRELDVLSLMESGFSNRQIAENLVLSEGTIKFHVHSILEKLDVHSRTAALARAKQIKLI